MDLRIFNLRIVLLEQLDHPWTVTEMANAAGLSISYFPTVFKGAIKMSPSAFLKDIRLEKAVHLLETSYEQIKRIGIQVGMPNESHFTRDFRIKYGVTPTEYRREYNENLQASYSNECEP